LQITTLFCVGMFVYVALTYLAGELALNVGHEAVVHHWDFRYLFWYEITKLAMMIAAILFAIILLGAMEFGVKKLERAIGDRLSNIFISVRVLGIITVMMLIGFTRYPHIG
jgi:hypothetical protein